MSQDENVPSGELGAEVGHAEDPDDDGPCAFLGHETVTTYEDEDTIQWECRVCGAEGWDGP